MARIRKTPQQRVTIKDIAAMAKVSIGTVDRVLHHRGEVNKETHDRIMSFVRELGYTPNLIAKSLALKKSFSIAVLIPDVGKNNPYWKKPIEGFKLASDKLNDYNTTINLFNYDPGDVISFINEYTRILLLNPDGIILAPNFHDAALDLVKKCRLQNIPYIFIDNNLESETGLAYFGQDAFQSGKVAGKLMSYGLKKGSNVLIVNLAHRKVITRHMQQREKGFTDYFNLCVPSQQIRTFTVSIDLSDKSEPSETLESVIRRYENIAGIFVTSSRIYKVAEYFTKVGKRSLILIGYDMVEENLTYMEKGIIDLLICQKPEDQGYNSAMAMFNYLLTGKQTEKVNYSPIDIIIKENINYYR